MTACTRGETGRHLGPWLVQKVTEGKNLLRAELESKRDNYRKKDEPGIALVVLDSDGWK